MKPGVKRFLIQFLIIIGIFVVIILLSQAGLKQFTRHGQSFTVPDFSGMSMHQAEEISRVHSLQIKVMDSLYLPNRQRGSIIRQIPEAGEKVKKNRRILVTINSIVPRKTKAPFLVGLSLRQAKAELASQNFQLGRLTYEYDIATNTVLHQYYNGQTLEPGTLIDILSAIDLTLGVNPEHNITYVPRVTGLSLDMAKDVITDSYLNVGRVLFDPSVVNAADSLAAVVIRQTPEASPYAVWNMGQEVNLVLSLRTPESETAQEGRK